MIKINEKMDTETKQLIKLLNKQKPTIYLEILKLKKLIKEQEKDIKNKCQKTHHIYKSINKFKREKIINNLNYILQLLNGE